MKKLTPEQEQELLTSCIEHGAKDLFVKQYFNLIARIVGNNLSKKGLYSDMKMDIEDLVNEVFIQIFEHDSKRLRQYDAKKGSKLTTWICMIATQTVVKHIRRKDPLGISMSQNLVPIEDVGKQASYSEEHRIESRQELAELESAMEQLSEDQRELIKCCELGESPMSPKEFAESTGRSVQAVYSMKNRAIENLRTLMKKDRPEDK